MTKKNAVSKTAVQTAVDTDKTAKKAELTIKFERLNAFCSKLKPEIPSAPVLLDTLREAFKLGIELPKGLRVYKRADGDYGVFSAKAGGQTEDKFLRSVSFRTRYTIVSADELFPEFSVWDYQAQNDKKVWTDPKWTTTPEARRKSALAWVKTMASCSEEAGLLK